MNGKTYNVDKIEYLAAIWRFLREENVSQSRFAQRMGTSRQYISKAIREGKASPQLLDKLTNEANQLAEERGRVERFKYHVKFHGEIIQGKDANEEEL